jgi:hypothetical protein
VIVDVWLLGGRLARRWYLTVPLFVAAALVAVQASRSVETAYSTETQVLLAPQGTPQAAIANPLLMSNRSSLDAATQSLQFVLDSTDRARDRAVADPGTDTRFSLVEEAPIVEIHVSGSHPDAVDHAARFAVGQVDDALRDIEEPLGAAPAAHIDTVQLAQPEVQEESGDQRRVLLGGLVAAAFGTALLVLALDQVLRRRLEHRLTRDLDREVGRLTSGDLSGPGVHHHRPG